MSKITPTSTRLVMKFKSRNPFVSLILVLMPPILPCLPCSNTTGKKKHAIRITPQKRIFDFQIHTIHTYLTKTITQWWFERFFKWHKKKNPEFLQNRFFCLYSANSIVSSMKFISFSSLFQIEFLRVFLILHNVWKSPKISKFWFIKCGIFHHFVSN